MNSPDSASESNRGLEQMKPKTRVPTAYPLPSNRNPFTVHFEVLRRFVNAAKDGDGVPAARVEGNGVPVQAASLNVRFLRSIGLVAPTQRGMYAPTEQAKLLVTAKGISDEKARSILANIVSDTWFAETARSAFRGKPIMTDDELLGELAWAAQTDKIREEVALRVLVDYLLYAGVVTRDQRGLSWSESSTAATATTTMTNETSTATQVTSGVAPERPVTEIPGWHILSAEDFYIKVKSDVATVDDVVAHLELLKKKILRLRAAQPAAQPNAYQDAPNDSGGN